MAGVQADTLYLACTRPAMKWGAPAEAFALNTIISVFGGMFLQNPLLWAVWVPLHFVMVAKANQNPGFFRELRMWFDTKSINPSGRLWAMSGRPPRNGQEMGSSV